MIWWTKSWNPVIGCTKCSPACDNCYAEALHTQRHKAKLAGAAMPLCYAEPFDQVRFLPERTWDPMRWRKPQRVFVSNMGDLFHQDVQDAWLDEIFEIMERCPQHIFMLLTKRPERMAEYLKEWHPLSRVWIGATIWDQASADRAVPILLSTPAAKRFVSVEPMLGPVDLGPALDSSWRRCRTCGAEALAIMDSPECGCAHPNYAEPGEPVADWVSLPALDWVICGGETGPRARPMHPDWPCKLRDDCEAAGVPFFFKQWGEWAYKDVDFSAPYVPHLSCIDPQGRECALSRPKGDPWWILAGNDPWKHMDTRPDGVVSMLRVGHRCAGRVLDGRTWEELPA